MVSEDHGSTESLDDVLAAVKETPRGRWFLEQYESRLRSNDTSKILAAIATLERQIQTMESSGAETALLKRARAAIAQARKDILELPGRPAELSAEGQLFAKLAILSKTHFPQDSGTSHGVDRALRLVADLDRDLKASQAPGENRQFFKQDEAIFEPAPAPKPVVVTSRVEQPAELPPRGAKLVIQRVASSQTQAADVAVEESPRPEIRQDMFAFEPAPEPVAVRAHEEFKAATESAEPPQTRIVIIRRKADEMDDVPLFEQHSSAQGEPASAA